MTTDALQHLLDSQDGVVARRQLLDLGLRDSDIARRLRRRELARVHPGVFVNHTGDLTWRQRAWAAVLYYWPSALCGVSALQAHHGTGLDVVDDRPIHVAIDERRRQRRREGVRLHRVSRLSDRVQPNRMPPRVSVEHAVVDLASTAPDEAAAVAVLADACQSRRTTPARLAETLRGRRRTPRRRFLLTLLVDVATGAYSALEHRYLTRVERPHGLPTGSRQRRVTAGRTAAYRDVDYRRHGVVVELDGRLGHEEQVDRWADMDRDIDAVVCGDVTLRAGWRQTLSPCRLAVAVGRLLVARGWRGRPVPCGPGCAVAGAFHASGDEDAPTSLRRPA